MPFVPVNNTRHPFQLTPVLRIVEGDRSLPVVVWTLAGQTVRRDALDEARAAIAEWLDVEAISFEIEANSKGT